VHFGTVRSSHRVSLTRASGHARPTANLGEWQLSQPFACASGVYAIIEAATGTVLQERTVPNVELTSNFACTRASVVH